jgi:pimeloyl-ACP methyl ester carboxylesterase
VVGHGFGAAVSLRLAADHPAAARAHVWVAGGTTELAGRFADWPTAAAAETPPYRPGDSSARMERMVRLGHPDWDELAVQGVLADVEHRPDGTVRPWLSAGDHRLFLEGLWHQQPSSLYPLVTAPVVVVVAAASDGGSTTRWAGVEAAEISAASAGLLRVRVQHIAGDQDLPSDRPDEVAAAIAGAAIDPPGAAGPSQ